MKPVGIFGNNLLKCQDIMRKRTPISPHKVPPVRSNKVKDYVNTVGSPRSIYICVGVQQLFKYSISWIVIFLLSPYTCLNEIPSYIYTVFLMSCNIQFKLARNVFLVVSLILDYFHSNSSLPHPHPRIVVYQLKIDGNKLGLSCAKLITA